MALIFLIYFFLLGIIIGSFLNVVVLRHNTGKTVGGRSSCMTCKTQLSSKELIPIVSYLIQRGRCLHCKTGISLQYPLVELITGILFALNFFMVYSSTASLPEFFVMYALSSSVLALLVATYVYDKKHQIIPDRFSFSVAGLSILYTIVSVFLFKNNSFWLSAESGELHWWLNVCAGLIFYLFIYLLWKFSNGRLIGLGDAKLLFGIGTILGIVYGLSALFLSFWIGTIYAVFILLIQRLSKQSRHITMKSEIAFGPFLIISFLVVYFLKIDVTNLGFILENF